MKPEEQEANRLEQGAGWRALELDYTRFNAERALGSVEESGLCLHEIAGATVLVDPARGALCNRVVNFGGAARAALPRVLELFREAGTPPRFDLGEEVATRAEVGEALREAGLEATYRLRYLTLLPSSGPDPTLVVERWGAERADEFLALLGTSGLECAPAVWERRRQHYCTDSFRTFVAFLEGGPRAWATSWAGPGGDYLANAYTQEGFRGRGCQSALLAARRRDAAERAVPLAVSDFVAESVSERNCRRAGFRPVELVTVWTQQAR